MCSHLHEIGPLKGGRNDVIERLVFDFCGAGGGVVGAGRTKKLSICGTFGLRDWEGMCMHTLHTRAFLR